MARETGGGGAKEIFQGVADVIVNSSGCETIMRDQEKITGQAVFNSFLFYSHSTKSQQQKQRKICSLDGEIRHSQAFFFFCNRRLFFNHSPTHSHNSSSSVPPPPFPFSLCFQCLSVDHMGSSHDALDVVHSEFLVSALCPIPSHSLLVIPESWHKTPAAPHATGCPSVRLLGSLTGFLPPQAHITSLTVNPNWPDAAPKMAPPPPTHLKIVLFFFFFLSSCSVAVSVFMVPYLGAVFPITQ